MRSRTIPTLAAGAAELVAWRRQQLLEIGLSPDVAGALAASRADLHKLIGLVDAGCPPQLAARIMAPLDLELPRA